MIRKNFSKALMITAMTLAIAPQFAWGFCIGSDSFCGTSSKKKSAQKFEISEESISQKDGKKTIQLRVQKKNSDWNQDYGSLAAKCVLKKIENNCAGKRDSALDLIQGINIADDETSGVKLSSSRSTLDKTFNLKISLRFAHFDKICQETKDEKCSDELFCTLLSNELGQRLDGLLFSAPCVAPIAEADGDTASGSLHAGPQ